MSGVVEFAKLVTTMWCEYERERRASEPMYSYTIMVAVGAMLLLATSIAWCHEAQWLYNKI
jgi:hypothetical protein